MGFGAPREPPVGHVPGNTCAGTVGGRRGGGGGLISFTGSRTPDDTPCVEWAAVTERVNRGPGRRIPLRAGVRRETRPPPCPGRPDRGAATADRGTAPTPGTPVARSGGRRPRES